MNWLKKLKKSQQNRHDSKIVKKFRTAGLASQCMNCKHFVYRLEKPRNWVCRCLPEKMRFVGNTCLGFEFGEHPEMVVMSSR